MSQITWNDCIQACDDLLDTLQCKMREEPEHGKFWQERMAVTMCKRQEFQILAKKQEDEQFMQSLQRICDNVLEKSRGQHE